MTERKFAELKIAGMVCAACSSAIEKALGNLEGVYRAQVNLATEYASIEYDPEKVNLTDLEKAVRDAGYEVINEHAVLKVGGMVCAMCVGALEIALKKLDGVIDARVNLAAEKAYVTYNPRMTSLADMKKVIEETGYQYLGVAGEEISQDLEKEALERIFWRRSVASSSALPQAFS
jgi:Cu+-exporting ATPase